MSIFPICGTSYQLLRTSFNSLFNILLVVIFMPFHGCQNKETLCHKINVSLIT